MANQVQVYDLFVTCVDKVGPLLKIWGQIDRQTSILIEQMLLDMLKQFELQNFVIPINNLQPGLLCCAKYKDGIYYRAQIRNLKTPIPGTVEVRFVDYGNIESIQLENIRLFEDNNLRLIKPQASEFILAGAIHSANTWDDSSIAFVHHEIAYTELKTILIGNNPHYKLVKVMLNETTDLASYLTSKGLMTPISPQAQEIILRNMIASVIPSVIPQQVTTRTTNMPFRSPPKNPELFTYKPELLPPNTEHMVYISYVEDGPYLFSVQLQSMEETLEQLMQQINAIPLQPFTAAPLPGNPCLARCVEDNTICRAVVLNLVGDKCKTYYVDFGNTDILPFSNIYQIPYNSLLPRVMSMRFTLTGLKNINITNEMKVAFKDYVTNKLLKLKVLKLDDSPLIQYCELYDENNKNILEVLYEISGEYKSLTMAKGVKHDVIVSYIEGCKKFFVQLKECSVSLNNLMLALASTSEMSDNLQPQEIKPNQACCAFYSGDNQWYRAKIVSLQNDLAIVKYVDYGNEDTVVQNQLKKLNPKFINILPAQAIECCLLGYQNMSFNTEIENAFESLTLECEFTMKVMGKLNNVLLVDLFDGEGNNVAALLIERLAAQKQQTLPAQQVANTLLNNTEPPQIRSFSPKDRSPKQDNWRSPENKPWRRDSGSEEKKNWRGGEEGKSWRNTDSPNAENPSDKNQWNEDSGAKGDSWESKPNFKKREYNQDNSRSRGDKPEGQFGDDSTKKPYNRNEFQRKPHNNWEDKKSGGEWNENKSDSWGNDKKPRDNTWGDERKPRDFGNDRKPREFGDRKPREFGDRKPRDNFAERKPRENWGDDRKPRENWGDDRKPRDGWKDDRKPRNDFEDRKPRTDHPKRDWNDDRGNKYNKKGDNFSENGSEKSWKSKHSNPRDNKTDNWGTDNSEKSYKGGKSFNPKGDYSSPKREIPKETQPLAELNEPYKLLEIVVGSNDTLAISWFYNPQNFFCQILSKQKDFRDMMVEIQSAYSSGAAPLSSEIPVGSSVIAEFHEDSILYRATVLEKKGNKYKVQYVDFGNIGLVDSKKIWQVEKRFMELPVQSIRCGISSIKPVEENWPTSQIIDDIFNKESFVCVFENITEEKYEIQMWDGENNIKDMLIQAGIAKDAAVLEMDGEPADIGLLLGQTIKLTLSCIYSLQKFYAQLDKNKMDEINNAISSYKLDSLIPLSSETIIPGTSCLVKLEDRKWCRGIISDNSNMEAISLNCPDNGKKIETSATNLYPLPPELCIYWYQAFECTLHNLDSDSCLLLSDEKFKEDYEDKQLIAFVDNVEEGRLIVTLYDTEGKKLDLFDPDEGAFPTVEKLCPLPVLTSTVSVYVTHINNTDSVFLQRASDLNTIANLLEKLFEYYEDGGEIVKYEQFTLCCAKSADGNWYRAKMNEEEGDNIKVMFIDYGNHESIPKDSIKTLEDSFYEHELALEVGLNLQETSPEFKDKFNEIISEKELKAQIYFGEDGWLADLYDGETSITQTLVDLNLATIKMAHMLQICPPKVENTENRAVVTVTHVDTPSEFYVQLNANENDITMLQLDLQEKVDLLPSLEVAEIGSHCAAKYTVDEQWYRAEVLDADTDITTVRFVDFGNTDVIDNKSNSIKTLPSELLAMDKYAKKCSLSVVSTKGEDWAQEACEMFENAINVDQLYADIVYQDEKTKTFVELFDGDKNIAEMLIDAGFAERITRDAEDDMASNTGFVSHLNSLSEFWIQFDSSIPDLEMIVDRLREVDAFPDLQDLSPGMLCAANYPEDEMWYRARILSNTVAGVEVIFIDYGNSSTALKLKVLPEELIHMPALALKCSLNKPAEITEWSNKANEKFKEISCEGATVFTVKKLAPGETNIVELFIENNNSENIVHQLISLCDEVDNRPSPIGKPNLEKCFINYFNSPDEIYVVRTSDSEQLDEIMAKVAEADTFEDLNDCEEGSLCVVNYEDLWYRAKKLPNDNYLLYDYGNIVKTENIKALPQELQDIPSMFTICTLDKQNFNEWNTSAKTIFDNIHGDGNNEYDIEFLNNDTPAKIRIFLSGVNIADSLGISNEISKEVPIENEVLNSEIITESNDIVNEISENLETNETSENLEEKVNGVAESSSDVDANLDIQDEALEVKEVSEQLKKVDLDKEKVETLTEITGEN